MAPSVPKLNLEGMSSTEGQKVAHQHVRGKLVVYPHDHDPVWSQRTTRARIFSADKAETEGTILSLSTVKTMGAPSGQWQAVVKVSAESDLDIAGGDIQDGDWADVSFQRNGIEFFAMRGIVESVRHRKSSAGGATVQVVQLGGKDHGAPFETPLTWQSMWVQSLGQLFRGIMTDRVKGAIGGSPDEMFRILIQAAIQGQTRIGQSLAKGRSSWRLPRSLAKIAKDASDTQGRRRLTRASFYEALSIVAGQTRGAYYNEAQLWTQVGQTLHQTLQQWCNPILNEVYYDLREKARKDETDPRQPEMVAYLRERPFVNRAEGLDSPWFKLETVTLPNWVIDEYDMGRDGSQRFNLIELIADFGFINPQEAAAFAAPIWDFSGIQTHGLKPWQQNVRYVAKEDGSQGAWKNERKVWQSLVADWYAPNPYFLSGTLGAGILVPEARIGEKLRYDTGQQKSSESYYLEGVEHRYSYSRAGHSGRTRFTVSRGAQGSDRDYLALVEAAAGAYEEIF